MPWDPQRHFDITLNDGTPLRIRAITPEDRERVAETFRRLSPESHYFRFWSHLHELNPRWIELLSSPDQHDHIAWAALHRERDDIPGIGGASFWRLKDETDAAEVSFTVADEFQGRGVATVLLAVLWLHAQSVGIQRFVGHVLHHNVAMRAWWDALGAVEQEFGNHWLTTLALDESLLQDTGAGRSLKRRLAEFRELHGTTD